MSRMWLVLVVLVSSSALASDGVNVLPAIDKVAEHLQEVSVTVQAGGTSGSGTIKTRNIDGKAVNFVWTAAHVIDGLRETKEVIDPKTGTKRTRVSYRDCRIVKELTEEGRRVGELQMDAEVVRVSSDEDLALLRVRKRDFVKASCVFYLDERIPTIGTQLYHVGSLLGQMGANSMTSGIVSQIGRILPGEKQEYDQTTCTAFPGSSGGAVTVQDGRIVGVLVRGAGEGFNLIVPVRRVITWARKADIEWAVDDRIKTPSEDQLKLLPVEDAGVQFQSDRDTKRFPYLIEKM